LNETVRIHVLDHLRCRDSSVAARHLLIAACGAGPASDIDRLIAIAHEHSWTAGVVATPSALDFIEVAAAETQTGLPVRSEYQQRAAEPNAPVGRLPSVDALVIAPATYNTINKLALGIADTYALTSAAELIGRGVPTVIVPFVNSALAGRAPFLRSVAMLREEGVRVLFGPEDRWEPHPPGTGADKQLAFPWQAAFLAAEALAGPKRTASPAGAPPRHCPSSASPPCSWVSPAHQMTWSRWWKPATTVIQTRPHPALAASGDHAAENPGIARR
jgi:hypothetical protein